MHSKDKLLIGRSEWCALPALSVPAIMAKIDTGAKTSSIHAFNVEKSQIGNQTWVEFEVHPIPGNDNLMIFCKQLMIDERSIMSSNGSKEIRPVIRTTLQLGSREWPIELTLSNREPLKHRMLLGREALSNYVLIDPALYLHCGRMTDEKINDCYKL
ncbi:MAG: RimK/LysX family protein [Legionellaceae bacterium]|nr:RimK/LysX family protein [Legionellaceae bacterium]